MSIISFKKTTLNPQHSLTLLRKAQNTGALHKVAKLNTFVLLTEGKFFCPILHVTNFG